MPLASTAARALGSYGYGKPVGFLKTLHYDIGKRTFAPLAPRHGEEALAKLPEGTDIVVLPELFSTGYSGDAGAMASLAERNTEGTIDRVKQWAAST